MVFCLSNVIHYLELIRAYTFFCHKLFAIWLKLKYKWTYSLLLWTTFTQQTQLPHHYIDKKIQYILIGLAKGRYYIRFPSLPPTYHPVTRIATCTPKKCDLPAKRLHIETPTSKAWKLNDIHIINECCASQTGAYSCVRVFYCLARNAFVLYFNLYSAATHAACLPYPTSREIRCCVSA